MFVPVEPGNYGGSGSSDSSCSCSCSGCVQSETNIAALTKKLDQHGEDLKFIKDEMVIVREVLLQLHAGKEQGASAMENCGQDTGSSEAKEVATSTTKLIESELVHLLNTKKNKKRRKRKKRRDIWYHQRNKTLKIAASSMALIAAAFISVGYGKMGLASLRRERSHRLHQSTQSTPSSIEHNIHMERQTEELSISTVTKHPSRATTTILEPGGDCPEPFVPLPNGSYEIGAKATLDGLVFEYTAKKKSDESSSESTDSNWEEVWDVIGSCIDGKFVMFPSLTQSSMLESIAHDPSQLPSASDATAENDIAIELRGSSPPTSIPSSVPATNNMEASSIFPTRSPLVSASDLYPQSTLECEGADPQTCGCRSVYQADYRGTISTTENGNECVSWDAQWIKEDISWFDVSDYAAAGLDDDNYCRNPPTEYSEYFGRAWCFTTTYEYENCAIVMCEDMAPSSSPSSSLIPTVSTLPTTTGQPSVLPSTSHTPTVQPKCYGSRPDECGCAQVQQSDYRGTISVAENGEACENWDSQLVKDDYWFDMADYPGLDGNYCRNPDNRIGGAWCHTREGVFNCAIPYCFPDESNCFDVDSTDNSSSDELQAACSYHQCVNDSGVSEYFHFEPLTRKDVLGGCQCRYEIWDCHFGSRDCEEDWARKRAAKCCDKHIATGQNFTDTKASCECSIGPGCNNGDSEQCSEFADICCEGDKCKCEYLTNACRLQLESDLDATACYKVRDECCQDDSCRCDFFDNLCNEFPNHKTFETCEGYGASHYCCNNDNCNCDLYRHATKVLGFKDGANRAGEHCALASDIVPDRDVEQVSLQSVYNATGGEHWSNNTGWMSESNPCDWYGISCNDKGYISELQLRSNNLIGEFPSHSLAKLYSLKTLDMSDNKLWGIMAERNDGDIIDTSAFFNLRELASVDLSQNYLSGEVDVLFAPNLRIVNFSHNNFTSINSFKAFKPSHRTLAIMDLTNNAIMEDISDVLKNIPINIEQFILSNNLMHGTSPISSENLPRLTKFRLDSNRLSGELPDFSKSFPNLVELDLSNQKQDANAGFNGTIPESLSNLRFLSTLYLAGNQLKSTIPPILGSYRQLKVLDLSDNELSKNIPYELGKLGGDVEIFNLSSNKLSGQIPFQLGIFRGASVHLSGNLDILNPAPLSLCSLPKFDLRHDTTLCPPERDVLKEFYDSAKGQEWTIDKNWADEYESHCKWWGVGCDSAGHTIKLELKSNGLSGTLSKRIADLGFLEVLDLSDNDIKGTIPTEIGLLNNLAVLRLNYNSFIGNETNFGKLKHLQMIQLHGNRLSGQIPTLGLTFPEQNSYIADCGNPSDFEQSLICEECTMCCNSQADCYPQEETNIQEDGFDDYLQFTGAFFAFLFLGSCTLAFTVFAYDKCQNRDMPREEGGTSSRTRAKALRAIGDDSVYQFLMGSSYIGWAIILCTMAAQIGILSLFIEGAEVELSDDNVDLVYTYRCSRDSDECKDTSDLNWTGWVVFGILMAAHLLKDFINGTKLIVLSAKKMHGYHSRMRFFFGGTLLITISSFTFYVSAIYNSAIATSNTEVIVNSVVILFIADLDELLYDILLVINHNWVERISVDEEEESVVKTSNAKVDDEEEETGSEEKFLQEKEAEVSCVPQVFPQVQNLELDVDFQKLKGDFKSLKREVKLLHKTMDLVQEENAVMKRRFILSNDA